MSSATRIYLIRHGETDLNAARILQPPATPLSERGVAQAVLLARRLADAGLVRILASDLRRAEMTAEAVAREASVPLERDPELAERNFGELRGTPYAELRFDPFAPGYTPPGGESWEVFHARVDRVWARVAAAARTAGGPIAVVTHGLVCHSVVTRLAELAPGLSLDGLRWRNTSVTVIEPAAEPRAVGHGRAESAGPAGAWRVTLLDDVAHLDEVHEGARA